LEEGTIRNLDEEDESPFVGLLQVEPALADQV
jgi:hypothetical protein